MTDALLDSDWLNRLASYHNLFIGFSGGLDSAVLLHHLACQPLLAGKLSAVHIHHGLSPNADTWLAHCQSFCAALSIPLIVRRIDVEKRSNIEEQARQARYHVFSTLVGVNDGLVLAHHADDQAETVLLQLFRGAGVDGLAAMPAFKSFGAGQLVRPYLQHSRKTLESYASQHQLSWVTDESNQDAAFSRNYLRHHVMPVLRARWPGVDANLARTASHCQQAKSNLYDLAQLDCTIGAYGSPLPLAGEGSIARIANVLRVWLQNNHTRLPPTDTFNRLINEVIFARHDATPFVEWDGVCVRRYQNKLYLLKTKPQPKPVSMEWMQFPEPLQLGQYFLQALPIDKGLQIPAGAHVSVRFRQGGELFSWHGQTKALKKLLQEWCVPPWQRDTLPLIYIDDKLAAVVGFAISDSFYGTDLPIIYHIELLQRE